MSQGAVKWEGSDLFGALSVHCVLVKHGSKFIKMLRTDWRPETVFSKHNDRNLVFISWNQITLHVEENWKPVMILALLIPWWPQMTSKFYHLQMNTILNGYFIGDSKRGLVSQGSQKKKNTDYLLFIKILTYLPEYLVSGKICSLLCSYCCSKNLSPLIYFYSFILNFF